MTTTDLGHPLPSFTSPPITEVAMSVHFASIEGLHVGHLGAYWQSVRVDLPRLEQQPPLPPQEAELLGGTAQRPGIKIEIVPMLTTPRFWFISEDQNVVVQVQPDRLVLNWRKIRPDDQYPRFPFMRQRFVHEWTRFRGFLRTEQLRAPATAHGEIAYVNTVTSSRTWQTHADAGKVFRQLRALQLPASTVALEDVRMYQRFLFPNRAGALTGRLHVQVEPVTALDTGAPAFQFTLTARGAPSDTDENLMDFMEAGRERIVRVFQAMTTDAMHLEWGLQ